MELSCLLKQLFSPREGHIGALYQIFKYPQVNLKDNPGMMVFDGTLERSPENFFELGTQYKEEWRYFYPDSE